MEKAEVKKKGNRIALAFLVIGVTFGIIYFISNQEWKEIQLPEPVELVQKFLITNTELVPGEVAIHFYTDKNTIKLDKQEFLKEVLLTKKVYVNYNILLTAGNTRYRIGIFYFWRHPGGWMESYTEPFLVPPLVKNVSWKLKKVSLNEAKDGVKLFYASERSALSTPGIIRTASSIASIGFFIIAVVIWFLVNF